MLSVIFLINQLVVWSIKCQKYVLFCPNPKVDSLVKLLWLIDKLLTMKFIINYYDNRLILLSHFLKNKCQNWPVDENVIVECEYFQFEKYKLYKMKFFMRPNWISLGFSFSDFLWMNNWPIIQKNKKWKSTDQSTVNIIISCSKKTRK